MHIYKLGKSPARKDLRTFRITDYTELPPAPADVDWTAKVPQYGMLCNDTLGCCVIAGMMHLAMQQRAQVGLPVSIPSDAEVIAAYSAIGGYVPGDPGTDQGCNLLDALTYWRKYGLKFGGIKHRITAFAQVPLHNPDKLASANWLFGGVIDGLALPLVAQGATVWTNPKSLRGRNSPGSWGGHCVVTCKDLGPLGQAANQGCAYGVVTWGSLMPEGQGFRNDYEDETYVVMSPEWIESQTGKSPAGFNVNQLMADLRAL